MNAVVLSFSTPTTVEAGMSLKFQVGAFITQDGKFVSRGGYVGNVQVATADGRYMTTVDIPSEIAAGKGTLTPTVSGQLQLYAYVDINDNVLQGYSNFITVQANSPTHLVLLNPPQLTLDTGEVFPMSVSFDTPVALTVQVQDQYNNPDTSYESQLGAQIIGNSSLKVVMNPPIVNGNATVVCTFTKGGPNTFTISVGFFEVQVTLDVIVLPE